MQFLNLMTLVDHPEGAIGTTGNIQRFGSALIYKPDPIETPKRSVA